MICLSQTFILRITIPEILQDEWFIKDYKPPVFEEKDDTNLDDVEAVFKDSEVTEKREEKPTPMNAFELISMSEGLNLGNLFDAEQMRLENLKGNLNVATEERSEVKECCRPANVSEGNGSDLLSMLLSDVPLFLLLAFQMVFLILLSLSRL
ncbi:hypothetical protein V6N11_001056 [Hibiscus sabdariffa]|uniref:NAF domain-containing protein n=1 Tax=Hibiscus sabdariffa TaxID=183260 RepID=A0ABR2RYK6_9ROSI